MRRAERKPGKGFPRGLRHTDHRRHADDLQRQATELLRSRPPRPPFEIDPRAILVVELNRPVDRAEWRTAGLEVLDDADTTALVALSARSDLEGFLARLELHREATPSDRGYVVARELFDAIESMRWYGAEDRVGPSLAKAAAAPEIAGQHCDLDIEVWYPGDRDTASAWIGIVRDAIGKAKGIVVDTRTDDEGGVILLRVRLSPAAALDVAKIDEIATIDLAPPVHLPHSELTDLGIESLRTAPVAAPDSPLVAIVDSGVSGAHPLIEGALFEAMTLLPHLADGSDEHGHGTAVAGVALYGPAERWIDDLMATGRPPDPVGRLLSIRVLDHRNEFPEGLTWGHALVEAVEYAAKVGAKIINLSLGHPGGAQLTRRSTPVASMLDTVARNLGVVLIVPTGNCEDGLDELAAQDRPERAYIQRLAAAPGRALLDPAPAALALTVGGTAGRTERLAIVDRALGSEDEPSAVTRRGPGTARGIKPELVAPAGTRAWNPTLGVVDRRPLLGQPLLSHRDDALFARDVGTSYAAPAVTHVAASVLAAHPRASSQLIRALVLQSAQATSLDLRIMPGPRPADQRLQRLHLTGYGTPNHTRAAFSTTNRVVLTAETAFEVDSVVLYEVPIPRPFFASGGVRMLDLAIAFDPLTRHRRKDYLASRLFAYVIPGRSQEEILEVLGRATEEELEAPLAGEDPPQESATAQAGSAVDELDHSERSATVAAEDTELGVAPPKLAALQPWRLSPSAPTSSDSANIVRRWRRSKRLDPKLGDTAYLAIRSTNRWAPTGHRDPVAIALALEYQGNGDIDLHAELRARLEVAVEIDVEA